MKNAAEWIAKEAVDICKKSIGGVLSSEHCKLAVRNWLTEIKKEMPERPTNVARPS